MTDRKLLGHDLWKKAREEAKRLWDDGYFDYKFQLNMPRRSMSVCKARIKTVEVEESGLIIVTVYIPPPPSVCLEGKTSTFNLP